MHPAVQNAGEGIEGRWTWIVLGLIFVSSHHGCHSDFHVILPETCNLPETFNLTWIRSMVNLGIREEQTHIILNIMDRKEICDGSKGLLKFISIAHADPDGKMIASLEPHLCPTATTFSRSHRKQFISWTCSQHAAQSPGVISLKPQISDVILAIQRMLKYSRWENVAITKSRFDKSRFCDDVGAYLQQEMKDRVNKSVFVLGNYEDLEHHFFSSITHNLDGLFFCISYDYGFTHNLSRKTELRSLGASARKIPLVLLPEWPLPVNIFTPPTPTLALVANSYPRAPTTSSFDFQPKNWDPVETTTSENTTPLKQLETLLAQMILKSVKLSLERDILAEVEGREATTNSLILSSTISTGASGSSMGSKTFSAQQTQHQQQQQEKTMNGKQTVSSSSTQAGNGGVAASSLLDHQFLFSVLQYEKARWHPLINLVNGEKHFAKGNDRPTSGVNYEEEKASAELKTDYLVTWFKVVLAILVLGLVVLGSGVIIFYYRAKSRRGLYKDRKFYSANKCRKLSLRHRGPGPYKILLKSSDITYGNGATPENTKRTSKSPFIGNLSAFQRSSQEKPDLLKGSFGGSSSTLRKQSSVTNIKNESGTLTGSTLGDRTARYKGDVVFLKKIVGIPASELFEVKMKAMLVLETLHGLRHENLVAMLGCLTEERPALVWEYCSRSSLYDIIKQKDIKLDWAFKLSLLTDLVRGMRYLHSSMIRCHGFLSSHNCVIDARWVLKITDYGMPALYQTQGLPYPSKSPKELLWTAPELLRDENLRRQGTQPGDIYSFAIIMQEVLVRGEPFCMLTLTPEEIQEKLKRPPPLIRPSVSKGSAPPEAVNIMRQCWAELPDMRPDFMVIHDLFKTLNHGRKANIVDTMFQMLEKYSNNLEELIRERTEQLDLEKKKTEQLLNRMLPNTVAEKLKLGLPVDPEEFQEVTIYFSDIVGFTTISAYSTPFEVVDLLNDLYTCFDATINDYNVYKVETIGDAYMCVGGAPIWAPDHADQIATMALDLLHQSGKFRIRHLPFTPLRLRIGLHTGSCCAGVVGLTMPRYCLFGDTVNTASRMESTGAPWRIHISGETKAKLDEAGGYITEYRGITEIKGKGPMHTFWLLGKEGFDKEMPTPPGLCENHGLDENSIKYGRTGIMPDGSESLAVVVEASSSSSSLVVTGKGAGVIVNKPSDTTTTGLTTTSSTGSVVAVASCAKLLAPPKVSSSFGIISGENVRSLSPAEQVAHQLLNGRPTTKGLRRQLSLDHKAMPVVLRAKATIRRAPSLEENMENTTCLNIPLITTSRSESQSSKTSILKHSPSPSPRTVSFEDKSSGSQRDNATISGDTASTTPASISTTGKNAAGSGSEEESGRRSETVVKVEAINNNLSSSVSKKTTEPIPSNRKSLLRNEITNVPVTSFDPSSDKFHNSIIVAQHGLPSNNTGENTTSSSTANICNSGSGASSSSSTSICSSSSNIINVQQTGQQQKSIGGASSSALQVGSTVVKINSNFPGSDSPQQQQQQQIPCNINSVTVTAITNAMTSTPAPAVASVILPSELIVKNIGGGGGGSTVVSNNIIITSADPKMRINSKKLAKVLSVVEESPKMERKYEISSPNPV